MSWWSTPSACRIRCSHIRRRARRERSGQHWSSDGGSCRASWLAVRFSLSLPLLRDLSSADPFAETFALARIAEEVGFDTATIGHHHFMPGNMADPLTFLTAVAARTDTPRGGTGIFQLPVHNPVRGAEQVATIDQGSGGRVSPGVRLGWGAPGDEGPRAG